MACKRPIRADESFEHGSPLKLKRTASKHHKLCGVNRSTTAWMPKDSGLAQHIFGRNIASVVVTNQTTFPCTQEGSGVFSRSGLAEIVDHSFQILKRSWRIRPKVPVRGQCRDA